MIESQGQEAAGRRGDTPAVHGKERATPVGIGLGGHKGQVGGERISYIPNLWDPANDGVGRIHWPNAQGRQHALLGDTGAMEDLIFRDMLGARSDVKIYGWGVKWPWEGELL